MHVPPLLVFAPHTLLPEPSDSLMKEPAEETLRPPHVALIVPPKNYPGRVRQDPELARLPDLDRERLWPQAQGPRHRQADDQDQATVEPEPGRGPPAGERRERLALARLPGPPRQQIHSANLQELAEGNPAHLGDLPAGPVRQHAATGRPLPGRLADHGDYAPEIWPASAAAILRIITGGTLFPSTLHRSANVPAIWKSSGNEHNLLTSSIVNFLFW